MEWANTHNLNMEEALKQPTLILVIQSLSINIREKKTIKTINKRRETSL